MSNAMEKINTDIPVTKLIEEYNSFMVPAYCIKIGTTENAPAEKDLLELHPPVAVFNCTVDKAINQAGSFSFTIDNPLYIENQSEKFPYLGQKSLFQPQRNVCIKIGYAGKLKTVINGFIESIDVSFGGNGLSQLTVKGFDYFKKMMNEKTKPFTWGKSDDQITYTEIVKKIAGKYKLAVEADDTKEKYAIVINDQKSDFLFIKNKLAKEVGYEVFVRDDTLHFHQPRLTKSVCIQGMEWGKSLISFTPRLDTSGQVTGVEGKGWDHKTQSGITYTAGAGSECNRGTGKSGSEAMQATGSTAMDFIGREELDTIGKVQQNAQAVLESKSQKLFSGSGECLGLPEIEPGRRIELLGLGERFSKKYYITKVTHSISSSGFKTQFSVADNTLKAGSK